MLPALGHVGKTFWLYLRKIVQLRAIRINVVQFPRAISALGDELPFALAHGAVAFMLPIDRLFTTNVLAVKSRRKRGTLQGTIAVSPTLAGYWAPPRSIQVAIRSMRWPAGFQVFHYALSQCPWANGR